MQSPCLPKPPHFSYDCSRQVTCSDRQYEQSKVITRDGDARLDERHRTPPLLCVAASRGVRPEVHISQAAVEAADGLDGGEDLRVLVLLEGELGLVRSDGERGDRDGQRARIEHGADGGREGVEEVAVGGRGRKGGSEWGGAWQRCGEPVFQPLHGVHRRHVAAARGQQLATAVPAACIW